MADSVWPAIGMVLAGVVGDAIRRARADGRVGNGGQPGAKRTELEPKARAAEPTTQALTSGSNHASQTSSLAEHAEREWLSLGYEVETVVRSHEAALRRRYQGLRQREADGCVDRARWDTSVEEFFLQSVVPEVPAANANPVISELSLNLTRRLANEFVDVDGVRALRGNDHNRFRDPADMAPAAFETFCAETLCAHGWDAQLTPATGDQGADIVAIRDGVRLVAQCKRYAAPVGNAAVQEIIAGRLMYRADLAAVVTTSSFTPAARELARVADVRLLHYTELEDL